MSQLDFFPARRLGRRVVHGTPITPVRLLDQLRGESFCVSFARPDQLDQCMNLLGEDSILLLDNGAFSHWRSGQGQIDRTAFWRWANTITHVCPQAVAVIPDVIEGSEDDNLMEVSHAIRGGCAAHPERAMAIWHMDDSLTQLKIMASTCNFVGIGSCAEFDVQRNRSGYLERLGQASAMIDWVEISTGRRPWVHLMRGLGVFHQALRFDSADSANIARNHNRTKGQPAHVGRMSDRIHTKIAAAAARR